MNESIGNKLAQVLSGICPVFENEAGTQHLPYAVYTLDTEPTYVKGGTSKIAGTLMLYIYARTAASALAIRQSVESAIATDMQGGQYRSKLRSATSDNDDESYMQTLEYFIAQIA